MKKRKAALLLSFCFVLGTAWAGQAINPLTARHIGASGATQQGEFMVTNPYPYDVEVKAEVSNQGYTSGGPAPLPSGNWISVTTPLPLKIKPDQTLALQYNVVFPGNLEKESVGLITLVVTKAGDSKGMALIRRGLPVYFVPGGTGAPALSLLQASASFMQAPGNLPASRVLYASIFVQNTGDVQLKPEGSLTMKRDGMVLETFPLSGQTPILAGASVPFTGRSAGTQWTDGDYQAFVRLGYGDAYGKPLQVEKDYRFTIAGNVVTVSPGSASPETVSPR